MTGFTQTKCQNVAILLADEGYIGLETRRKMNHLL